jgi:electron-transferring-flavoprotein dehydrogenase
VFPGGALIGCCAGFLNVPKIKGNHTAMKSGMLAAEAAFEALGPGGAGTLEAYPAALRASWVQDELSQARNVRPGFRFGLFGGLAHAALDTYLLRGKAPWTLHHHPDYEQLKPARRFAPIDYPKPDGKLTFDRLSSVYISNTNHDEDQPCHLRLKDPKLPIELNLAEYDAPEQRYCPAGVYEIVRDGENGAPRLQINAQNCVHCKTCDIKDPAQNIDWVVPQGGDGPNYAGM